MRLCCNIEFCPPDELQVTPVGSGSITQEVMTSIIKMVAGPEPAFKLECTAPSKDDQAAHHKGDLAPELKRVQYTHQVEIMVATVTKEKVQQSAEDAVAELWVWPTAWAVPKDVGADAVATLQDQMKRARQAVMQASAAVQSSAVAASSRRNVAPVLQRTLSLDMETAPQRSRGGAGHTDRSMGHGRSTTAEEEERWEAQQVRQQQKRQQKKSATSERKKRDKAHRQERDNKLNQAQVE